MLVSGSGSKPLPSSTLLATPLSSANLNPYRIQMHICALKQELSMRDLICISICD